MTFDLHIDIDYSGRETPTSRTPALQVYAAFGMEEPRRIQSPSSTEKTYRSWCRKEIAEWLIQQAKRDITFVAGIDHGFSFPLSYFERYMLESWPQFLDDFCKHWPTDDDHTYVDFIRDREEGPPDRTGDPTDLRMTEKRTSSAKSVFHFDVQGSVAKSAHAGLPWLRRIRAEVGGKVHFWPSAVASDGRPPRTRRCSSGSRGGEYEKPVRNPSTDRDAVFPDGNSLLPMCLVPVLHYFEGKLLSVKSGQPHIIWEKQPRNFQTHGGRRWNLHQLSWFC